MVEVLPKLNGVAFEAAQLGKIASAAKAYNLIVNAIHCPYDLMQVFRCEENSPAQLHALFAGCGCTDGRCQLSEILAQDIEIGSQASQQRGTASVVSDK